MLQQLFNYPLNASFIQMNYPFSDSIFNTSSVITPKKPKDNNCDHDKVFNRHYGGNFFFFFLHWRYPIDGKYGGQKMSYDNMFVL